MEVKSMTDDDTVACENCEQQLDIDEMSYSEQLDTYYCDACCDSMEQDECDARADHMMSVMEAMD
jgi:transcription elongation factor Elf1